MNDVDAKKASEDLKNILELASEHANDLTSSNGQNQFYVYYYASNFEDIAIAYQKDIVQYVEQQNSQLPAAASALAKYDSTRETVVGMVNGYLRSGSPEIKQEALTIMVSIEREYPGAFENIENTLKYFHDDPDTLISNEAHRGSHFYPN
jgi:hypothetical protein